MGSAKILIIDDEVDVTTLTAKLLEMSGYDVSSHFDGHGAFDAVKTQKPDLILLDIRLPNITGIDLFNQMRADEQLKSIPVVFFSASATDKERCMKELKADGYIEKPFELDYLLETVKKLLEGRKGKSQ